MGHLGQGRVAVTRQLQDPGAPPTRFCNGQLVCPKKSMVGV